MAGFGSGQELLTTDNSDLASQRTEEQSCALDEIWTGCALALVAEERTGVAGANLGEHTK
jgi:hypothetical protein